MHALCMRDGVRSTGFRLAAGSVLSVKTAHPI
jgi:hypothetical protein